MIKAFNDILPPHDDDISPSFKISCQTLTGDVLSKVIEFCTHYVTVEKMDEIQRPFQSNKLGQIVKQDWYVKFVELDIQFLIRLVNAANYLEINPLLNLTILATALSFDGKSENEIRKIFHLPSRPKRKIFDNNYYLVSM
jgi:hypothetical protein